MSTDRVFLTAEWRDLLMLNYEVDPALVSKFVPSGTELDFWNGKTYISIVGFRFLQTKVFGVSFPFHRNFDEVNLRFYVRRLEAHAVKRGVVFIREFVPRKAIAIVARAFYNEKYAAVPMSHRIHSESEIATAEYRWKSESGWNQIALAAKAEARFCGDTSLERFITEHYWGYAVARDGHCIEYRVAHPAWRVRKAEEASFEGNAEEFCGKEFAPILSQPPSSAFLAEGSEIKVYRGKTAITAI